MTTLAGGLHIRQAGHFTAPALLLGSGLVIWGLLGESALIATIIVVLDVIFFAYFVRHTAFAFSALSRGEKKHARLHSGRVITHITDEELPSVSVLVACKNEANVAQGLVSALLALDYPEDRLQILVVDDGSTDGTEETLALCTIGASQLRFIRRPPGHGTPGKAGALNYALPHVTGEIVVIFDADHRPHPDVLRLLVRHFADPMTGAVQGRCRIRNANDAPITRAVAVDYLAGYLVNEFGRQSVYGMPAYGGANCAIRTASLRALGGWNDRTVVEDTDISMRLQLAGHRIRYEPAAIDEEEGVITLRRYWRQRYRWARGHQQVCRDYFLAVWQAGHFSLAEKIETTMFLLVYHVPVACFSTLVVVILWFGGAVPYGQISVTFLLWTLLFLGPMLELAGGLLLAGIRRRDALSLIWFLPIFLLSGAICTKAWIDGIFGVQYSWVRTARAAARPTREHG